MLKLTTLNNTKIETAIKCYFKDILHFVLVLKLNYLKTQQIKVSAITTCESQCQVMLKSCPKLLCKSGITFHNIKVLLFCFQYGSHTKHALLQIQYNYILKCEINELGCSFLENCIS